MQIAQLLHPTDVVPCKRRRVEHWSIAPTTVEASPWVEDAAVSAVPNLTVAIRLLRSRDVGRRHRQNESERLESLEQEVEMLRATNAQLCAQLALALPSDCIPQTCSPQQRQTYALSSCTTDVLGRGHVYCDEALLLLELIALRRNLVCVIGLPTALECPSAEQISAAVRNAGKASATVRDIHSRWALYEEFTTPMYGRSKMERRCQRCGKRRTAGWGHARSFCDDGHKVDSCVPYTSVS